jgi:hypothetical protein
MNPPPLPVGKRFPWILYWIVLVLIVLVALAPVGSVVACGLIANAHGCRVDEGSGHPCMINGKDYGQLLYTLGVMGWLMLVTLPAGALAFVLWLGRSYYSSNKLAKTHHELTEGTNMEHGARSKEGDN